MKQKNFYINGDYNPCWDFIDYNDSFDAVNVNNFPAAFFSIIGIMAEDCHYHIKECYSSNNRLFFVGRYKNNYSELMLRYGDSELIVARIRFAHKRVGNMTRLYAVLKHIKRAYHLKRIIIEAVGTDEMRSWCVKNNLKPITNDKVTNWE